MILKEIDELKKSKNAVILAHNYQPEEIYQVADFVGDSLELARVASNVEADVIVFCGVRFMAETAKILNPEKKVLLAANDAGCQMAEMISATKVRELRNNFPDAAVACYVNTTAETKTECDVCVTSSNAVKIINSLPQNQIIFVPDKNLGSYVAKNCSKKIILTDGYCYVHDCISVKDVEKIREKYHEAPILVHPESPSEVVDMCDYVCSTSQMISVSKEVDAKVIIVGTEIGMLAKLRQEVPEKTFVPLKSDAICGDMKLTDLDMVKDCLLHEKNEIFLDKDVMVKAKSCIDKMLLLS